MTLKINDNSYCVRWNGTQIEYWEYVLRTIRTRHGITYGYWWCKLPGITWGKISPKQGDFGWLPGVWTGFREKRSITRGRPYAATKLGALRDEISDLRRHIEDFGPDTSLDDNGPMLKDQLKAALSAQKRMRNAAPAAQKARGSKDVGTTV